MKLPFQFILNSFLFVSSKFLHFPRLGVCKAQHIHVYYMLYKNKNK